jgi:dTMP kinase
VVHELNRIATGGLLPDLTILLRVDPETGLDRAQSDDRFEAEGVAFQQLVAGAYEEIALREPERVVTVDGSGTPEEVHQRILEAVKAGSGAGAAGNGSGQGGAGTGPSAGADS